MNKLAWWQILVFVLLLVLIAGGFILFLYWQQDRLNISSIPPVSENQPRLSMADLDRQELQPKELPETINAQNNPDLYTTLKTMRGEIVQLKDNFSLVVKPIKNKIIGHEPVIVAIDKLDTITCWPKYYQADDGSKVALSEAYISIQKDKGEFYWANQKMWPFKLLPTRNFELERGKNSGLTFPLGIVIIRVVHV